MNSSTPTSTRRNSLRTTAAGAVVGADAVSVTSPAATPAPTSAFPNFARGEVVRTRGELVAGDARFAEAPREIPVAGRSEVLVVGAGPAGIGAALAAARAGAETQLIESAGCLGGVWTAGMLTKIIDGGRKAGIMQEILRAMTER